MYLMWGPRHLTLLLPVWPRDAKRLDTPVRYPFKIRGSTQKIHTETHLEENIYTPHTHTCTHEFLAVSTFLHVMTGGGAALTSQDRCTCAPVTL